MKDNRKTYRIIEGVDLVACLRAVEIEVPVGLVVPVIYRQPVRIAVLAVNRQHSAHLTFDDVDALFVGQLLLESPHLSEHIHVLLMKAFYNICADCAI